MRFLRSKWCQCVFVCSFVALPLAAGDDLGDLGTFGKWSEIEISFRGPSMESEGNPNPFDVEIDVTFVGPSGQTYDVPGFFDGDGAGGPDGDVWRVRFGADEVGEWAFSTESAESRLDGVGGRFEVVAPAPGAPDFYRWGRLEYVGTPENRARYFKFRDGPHWLKAGADDPENFLGSSEPYDTLGERLATIDYLAQKGINSMYILTHNIGGDDKDVWPWIGDTHSEAKDNGVGSVRFDIPRLTEWREIFEHMQEKGVVPYLILEDDAAWHDYDHDRYYREIVARFGDLPALLFNICEESNEVYTLSQAIGFADDLAALDPYDHPIAIHNENKPYSDDGQIYLATETLSFSSIQTSDHGIDWINDRAIDWIEAAVEMGVRVPVVNFDEARPEEDRAAWWAGYMGGGVWEAHTYGPWDRPIETWDRVWTELGGARAFMEQLPFWSMSPANELITAGDGYCFAEVGEVYAVYLKSGGSVTLDLAPEATYDYRWWNPDNGFDARFQNMGTVSGGSQRFESPGAGDWALLIENSDGNQNQPPTAVISSPDTGAIFAPGVPIRFDGSQSYDLDGRITEHVWNFGDGQVAFGSVVTYAYSTEGEFTVTLQVEDDRLERSAATVELTISGSNVAPEALDQTVAVVEDWSVSVAPAFEDRDGPGPYAFEIVAGPSNGVARVVDGAIEYRADTGFLGRDGLRWRVHDGLNGSQPARMTFVVSENVPPRVRDFALDVSTGTEIEFTMMPYVDDPDGPQSPRFRLVEAPVHGRVSGDPRDNDFTYRPAPGFVGTDEFSWKTHDGLDASDVATVTVRVLPAGLSDAFDRPDSEVVGGGWIEVEEGSNARTAIEGGQLVFYSDDDSYRPLISHALPEVTTGVLRWSFDLDFDRSGGESVYSFHMQLGYEAAFTESQPLADGVAVNLEWGGPAVGLDEHEALGFVVDGVVTQVAVVEGAHEVTVLADLDAGQYAIFIDGTRRAVAPFDNDVPIDTVRFLAHELNDANFSSRAIDNVTVGR